ncbi:Uncharacterised protein [Mycobacteroides abscessus subsp. abscessus]|nr:Uncharacterised protein [Mycobacteroides abscessus subsp. abscessus]
MQPCASDEVPESSVSTFGLPWAQAEFGSAGSIGSNHAPVDSCTTWRRRPSSRTAPARQAPRSLNTRTTSPSAIPRVAASCGCIRRGSRPRTFDPWLVPPKSSWLCSLVRG